MKEEPDSRVGCVTVTVHKTKHLLTEIQHRGEPSDTIRPEVRNVKLSVRWELHYMRTRHGVCHNALKMNPICCAGRVMSKRSEYCDDHIPTS